MLAVLLVILNNPQVNSRGVHSQDSTQEPLKIFTRLASTECVKQCRNGVPESTQSVRKKYFPPARPIAYMHREIGDNTHLLVIYCFVVTMLTQTWLS